MEENSEMMTHVTADMDQSTAPKLAAGHVLNRSWSTMMKNPGLYLGLALIPTIPGFLGDVLSGSIPLMGSLMSIIASCLGMVLQAAIAYAVYRSLNGEKSSVSEAMSKGLKRFLPVLGASFLVGLLTGIGYLLLVVPGLILTCILIVTVPACVVEHTGAIDSMRRSSILTKGNRWTIFFLVALVFVVIAVISAIVMAVAFSLTSSLVAISLIIHLLILVPTAFQSVMVAVIYYTLREIREGVSVESLANVFD